MKLINHFSLDGIITLIDSKNAWSHLKDIEVAWEQIAFSHILASQ